MVKSLENVDSRTAQFQKSVRLCGDNRWLGCVQLISNAQLGLHLAVCIHT